MTKHFLFNPIIGALINCLWFGLADLYSFRVLPGLIKMLLHIPLVIICAMLTQVAIPYRAEFAVGILYLAFLGISGYRTVAEVRSTLNSNSVNKNSQASQAYKAKGAG